MLKASAFKVSALGMVAGALAIGGVAVAQDAAAPADGEALTIYSGVFTDEQADRGMQAFSTSCAVCHGSTGRGGPDAPGLIGFTLDRKYADQPLFNYFHIMQTTMPFGRGNSLPAQTYADITAFLLKSHGAEAGDTELTPDEALLNSIQIVAAP